MDSRVVARASSSPPKQRRGSLPASPALNALSGWSFRDEMGLPSGSVKPQFLHERSQSTDLVPPTPPTEDIGLKRTRKKWTQEETQMLVDGCNTHGVGNWKAILSDPKLTFEAGRTPVDLKDRFRTYFPDAYRQHYPNAKTHLSDKVRSTLPNGGSIFEKTRTKRRRPFSQEEDEALRRGYQKHGTLWAQIAQDPIFVAQQRRSTDLRDRFRNAFPDLYEAAGYKPRTPSKKAAPAAHTSRSHDGSTKSEHVRARAARRRLTYPGMLHAPTSTPASDALDYSSGEEDSQIKSLDLSLPKQGSTSRPCDIPATPLCVAPSDTLQFGERSRTTHCRSTSPLPEQDSISLSSQSHILSGPGSPSSPRQGLLTPDTSRDDEVVNNPWTEMDWLAIASQSRLPHVPLTASSLFSANMYGSGPHHDVLDRYDLYSSPLSSSANAFGDYVSEMGLGGSFSEADMDLNAFAGPASSMGFTHHSQVAGDLIFASHHGGHLQHGHGFSLEPSTTFRSYGDDVSGTQPSSHAGSSLGLSNVPFASNPTSPDHQPQFDPHAIDTMLASGDVSLALLGQGPHAVPDMSSIFSPTYTVSPADLVRPASTPLLIGDAPPSVPTTSSAQPFSRLSPQPISQTSLIAQGMVNKHTLPVSGPATFSSSPAARRSSPFGHLRSASQPPTEQRLLEVRRAPLHPTGLAYNPPITTRDDSMQDFSHRGPESYQLPFLDLHYYGVLDSHSPHSVTQREHH